MPACTECGRHVPKEHEAAHAAEHRPGGSGPDPDCCCDAIDRLVTSMDVVSGTRRVARVTQPAYGLTHFSDMPDLGSEIPNEGTEDTTTEEE